MAKPRSRPAFESKVPPRPAGSQTGPGRPAPRRPSARAEAFRRRRNRRLLAFGASALVVVVVAVLIIVKVTSGSSNGSTARTAVPASALNQLSSVPVSTLVGAATSGPSVSAPTRLASSTQPLTSGGEPEVLYMGAEFCPFCAAERWPLVMALSRFGTFSNLSSTKSSSTDTNPNTPTFSFYGSTYSSAYLTFTPVELEDRNGKALQTPTSAQSQLLQAGTGGTIPFIDLGGKYKVSGTQYNGAALSGKSFDNALASVTSGANNTSKAAQAVAGHLIGVMCSLTGNQPSSVCSAVPASLKSGQAGSGNQGSSRGS